MQTLNNGKTTLTNNHFCSLLEDLNIGIVYKKNIVDRHLRGEGFHLNPHGNGRPKAQ